MLMNVVLAREPYKEGTVMEQDDIHSVVLWDFGAVEEIPNDDLIVKSSARIEAPLPLEVY